MPDLIYSFIHSFILFNEHFLNVHSVQGSRDNKRTWYQRLDHHISCPGLGLAKLPTHSGLAPAVSASCGILLWGQCNSGPPWTWIVLSSSLSSSLGSLNSFALSIPFYLSPTYLSAFPQTDQISYSERYSLAKVSLTSEDVSAI